MAVPTAIVELQLRHSRLKISRWYRHIARCGTVSDVVKDKEEVLVRRANRRCFDCASCDETARGFAQDDTSYINQSLRLRLFLYQAITYA
jgi:hypothetical protein